MGIRNYLIEGVSGTEKTSVCNELQRRGYRAIHGDIELAYQGDPETGKPTDGVAHEHHIWHVDQVRALVANQDEAVTFFCERPEDEWGGRQTERDLITRLHRTKEDIPNTGTVIDATAPIARVVDEIVRQSASRPARHSRR